MNSLVKGVSALAAVLFAFAASAEPFKDGDTVVFLGDSITHGGRYHEFIADFYRTRYPGRHIRFVNSGIGGDSAGGAMKRVKEKDEGDCPRGSLRGVGLGRSPRPPPRRHTVKMEFLGGFLVVKMEKSACWRL